MPAAVAHQRRADTRQPVAHRRPDCHPGRRGPESVVVCPVDGSTVVGPAVVCPTVGLDGVARVGSAVGGVARLDAGGSDAVARALFPVSHDDVDAVVDGEADEQHRRRDEHQAEVDAEPAHETERPGHHQQDADESEREVEEVAVGDRQREQDEQECDGTGEGEAIRHRLLLLGQHQPVARQAVLVLRDVLGYRFRRHLALPDLLGEFRNRDDQVAGGVGDDQEPSLGLGRPRLVARREQIECGLGRAGAALGLGVEQHPDQPLDLRVAHRFEGRYLCRQRRSLPVESRTGLLFRLPVSSLFLPDGGGRDEVLDAERPALFDERRVHRRVLVERLLVAQRCEQRLAVEDVPRLVADGHDHRGGVGLAGGELLLDVPFCIDLRRILREHLHLRRLLDIGGPGPNHERQQEEHGEYRLALRGDEVGETVDSSHRPTTSVSRLSSDCVSLSVITRR
ncbi:hypothetical protein BRC65_08940 [Halobacteriales archaeon QH_2_65_14]|nr:MAG: hypothetical protein BRC65_08940 [Halobacteriales archaeon QH_2_65_14]